MYFIFILALHVPEDSRLAIGLEKAEQERQKQKEEMRKLTIEMANRQHLEEVQQEALGKYQSDRKWTVILDKSLVRPDCLSINDRPFKGSPYTIHFIFEINVGKRRIRQRTTLNLNFQSILSRSRTSSFNFWVFVCRIRLFPTLISRRKWHGYELPLTLNRQ